jgi:hypothetical protein
VLQVERDRIAFSQIAIVEVKEEGETKEEFALFDSVYFVSHKSSSLS